MERFLFLKQYDDLRTFFGREAVDVNVRSCLTCFERFTGLVSFYPHFTCFYLYIVPTIAYGVEIKYTCTTLNHDHSKEFELGDRSSKVFFRPAGNRLHLVCIVFTIKMSSTRTSSLLSLSLLHQVDGSADDQVPSIPYRGPLVVILNFFSSDA